ncbi:precorrin-6Y C5,15-methyltransferase (decarboxylating) [Anaerotaenia torta]|uniref:precorrin-6A reductase n=1 Tax=Anaerotaenia torta TaxID=433293 RepID=UPI003D22F0C9
MKQILIFGGTTEGRSLAEYLTGRGIGCTVCVATDYGRQVMEEKQGPHGGGQSLILHQGRMTAEEMKEFIAAEDYLAVVDATHPFAAVVSENIKESLKGSRIPYLRLSRDTKKQRIRQEEITGYSGHEECVRALKKTRGNILLTTGSKELAVYAGEEELRARLYVRVLPGVESILACQGQGLAGKQIIAMQGPFSREMNEAMLRQFDIRYLVTKESGSTGGFEEKLEAAGRTGTQVMIIGNPEKEPGYTMEEVCRELERLTGIAPEKKQTWQISLIGMGMGSSALLTGEAWQAIDEAEVIFGAERLLEDLPRQVRTYPYYLAGDIIPCLKEIEKKTAGRKGPGCGCIGRAVILFSGDTGFYSGAQKLYEALQQEIAGGELQAEVRICPGISSLSYLCARAGMSWQDARILSIHGRSADVPRAVRSNRKSFLLVSGLEDMRRLGAELLEAGLDEVRIIAGYQLSYPEEQLLELHPEDLEKLEEQGLYSCLLLNERVQKRTLTHGRPDSAFLRDKVPMTKEEIREVSICKLRLYEEAVLYDIGSGTGSIAVESAELSDTVQVYAIEKKEEAACLLEQNQEHFGLRNIRVIRGEAPEVLKELPPPTHVFIGGSSGNLRGILDELYRKNPTARVVINAVTLETISEITFILKDLPAEQEEIVQIQASRARTAGSYHMMLAENPVYIVSFDFTPGFVRPIDGGTGLEQERREG